MTSASGAERIELEQKAQRLIASDYFAALGVPRDASVDDVKRAFLAAAKSWHPDRVPPGMQDLRPTFAMVFAKLDEARAVLCDPAKRQAYLAEGAPASAPKVPAGASPEANVEYRKAEAFLKKNDLAQAEAHIRRAIHLAPARVDYQVMAVWIQASKPDCTPDRLRQLVGDLDKLVAKDEKCERAYFYRGTLRKRLDMIPQAMSDFAKAAELNPQNVDAVREVRIYKMRQEGASKQPKPEASAAGGVGGFFKKLFKK